MNQQPGEGWATKQGAANLTPPKTPLLISLALSSVGYFWRQAIRDAQDQLKITVLAIAILGYVTHTIIDTVKGFHNIGLRKSQPKSYHNFADNRCWCCSIPNSSDVLSNIPFIIALYPAWKLYHYEIDLAGEPIFHDSRESIAWFVCFFGTGLVSLGSAYYHWRPTNSRLVWDRLPMTMSFMSIQYILLTETLGVEIMMSNSWLLWGLLVSGFGSVVYWAIFDDLTLYKTVQFLPQMLCPLLLIGFEPIYTMRGFYVVGLGFYALAKITENNDKRIYKLTKGVISGHTIKHFCAALALYTFYFQMMNRIKILTPQTKI